MSKDEFLKIQTCVLKVNVDCDGCKQKVKKILQKIDGVYTIKIDSEQGKVTVSGIVDPATLIKKLVKNRKHAEIWGASKTHNNFPNQLNNQLKNLMIDNGKGRNNKKGNIPKDKDDKPKGGGQDQLKLLQQLQQMKGFQDLKPLPLSSKDHGQKSGKLTFPEDEDLSGDEFDEDDGDDYDDDYDEDEDVEFEDDVDDAPLNKMKPVGGNGHGGSFMSNSLMNTQNLVKNGANNGGNGGGIHKKGAGGENDGGANGGKKGGAQLIDSKKGGGGGGKNKKNDNHGGSGFTNGKNPMPNGAKKSGGMNDKTNGMPHMMAMNLPIGQMGNIPTQGPMTNLPAIQGLPALNAPSGGGGGYFHGRGPEHMAGNPYQQQQLAAMMMNQRHVNGNESFQPMIYARPPPAVNYMPSYLPYPYPAPPGEHIDQYSMFSDENTSGCYIM